MFIIEILSSFSKTPSSDSQGQLHEQCTQSCPVVNVLSHSHPRSIGTLWNQHSFFWSGFQNPLALPSYYTCLVYASDITYSRRRTWRQSIFEGWRPKCAYFMFHPINLKAFLRLNARSLGERSVSFECKQVLGGARQSIGRKDMKWKWMVCYGFFLNLFFKHLVR